MSADYRHIGRSIFSATIAVVLGLVGVVSLVGNIEVVQNLSKKGTFPNDVLVWFLALPQWAIFIAGFGFAVVAFRKSIFKPAPAAPVVVPKKVHWLSAARFADWDDIDPLALYQVANLWAGKEPRDTKITEGEAHTMMIRLSEAIRTRKLKIAEVHGENGNMTAEAFLHGTMLRQMKPNELVDRDVRISRDTLKAYAERIGEKPKFLFPEMRK